MAFTINTETMSWSQEVLEILLFDVKRQKNIVWSTDNYTYLSDNYQFHDHITLDHVLTTNSEHNIILPRVLKSTSDKNSRTKANAEVFTPSWICNLQNNIIDELWFAQKDVFNVVDPTNLQTWHTNTHNIPFSDTSSTLSISSISLHKTWQDYVLATRLEITCGEAPYLVSRYDAVTGQIIPLTQRIGLLDRKLRVIMEHTHIEAEWLYWTAKAFQSVFGFEYSGDSLVIARENLLASFYEYTVNHLQRVPTEKELITIATIISANLWQDDAITSSLTTQAQNISNYVNALTTAYEQNDCADINLTNLVLAVQNSTVSSISSVPNSLNIPNVKFDAIVGNPPYQKHNPYRNRNDAIYDQFMDLGYNLSDVSVFITPARFLFNAGSTSNYWNERMLNDQHLKVEHYFSKSEEVFSNVDITGGIVITSHNVNKTYNPIKVFFSNPLVQGIYQKVSSLSNDFAHNLSQIMFVQNKFNLDTVFADFPELQAEIKTEKRLTSAVFYKYSQLFKAELDPIDDVQDFTQIYGRVYNNRTYMWIKTKYLEPHANLDYFKVFVPAANGSKAISTEEETVVIGTPELGHKHIGHTQTFISLGKFDYEFSAQALLKYLKTKFARFYDWDEKTYSKQ